MLWDMFGNRQDIQSFDIWEKKRKYLVIVDLKYGENGDR